MCPSALALILSAVELFQASGSGGPGDAIIPVVQANPWNLRRASGFAPGLPFCIQIPWCPFSSAAQRPSPTAQGPSSPYANRHEMTDDGAE